jgi:hypothetical protein
MAIYAYYTGTGLRNSTESEKNSQQLLLKYCIYCSPIDDDDRSTNPTSPIHVTDVDAHVEIEEL